MKPSPATLYYIHDPMCSWCWAFQPVWQTLQQQLAPHIQVVYLLGGLAADSAEPMSAAMQTTIQQHWRRIEKNVPHIRFNFDFWTKNTEKRSTFPACRAVIAAKMQHPNQEQAMIHSIQTAYYLHASSPSEDATLLQCAKEIGLDVAQFQADLHAPSTQDQLDDEMQRIRSMHVASFPSLVLQHHQTMQPIPVHYTNTKPMLAEILKNTG